MEQKETRPAWQPASWAPVLLVHPLRRRDGQVGQVPEPPQGRFCAHSREPGDFLTTKHNVALLSL